MSEIYGPTLTVEQARVRHPAVGRGRLYAAAQSGALPTVLAGKRLAIPVDGLDQWVGEGCPVEPALSAVDEDLRGPLDAQ